VTSGDRLAEVLACTATSEGPRLLEVPITAETRPLG
jgi:benzoylformate decarboxylase